MPGAARRHAVRLAAPASPRRLRTVSIEPRLAGERKPSIAHAIEMKAMHRSCMPVPTEVASSV
eukprot:6560936-Prymnesium_polylepis.1